MGGAEAGQPDTVRVLVTLAGDDLDQARTAFGLTEPSARPARLYFCEQLGGGGQLPLYDAGLLLRLRAGGDRESVVTLRPARPERLPVQWAGPPPATGVRIVGEWTPYERVVTVAVHAVAPRAAVRLAVLTSLVAAPAFSAQQRRFLEECAPVRPRFRQLRALGPVELSSWIREVQDLRLAADLWTLPPTALHLLELSVVAQPSDAALVQPVLSALVRSHGLDPEAFSGTSSRVILSRLTAWSPRGGSAPGRGGPARAE